MASSWVLTAYFSNKAIDNWANNPVKTTTQPFPIYDAQFPKIIVCPPKVDFGFRTFNVGKNFTF